MGLERLQPFDETSMGFSNSFTRLNLSLGRTLPHRLCDSLVSCQCRRGRAATCHDFDVEQACQRSVVRSPNSNARSLPGPSQAARDLAWSYARGAAQLSIGSDSEKLVSPAFLGMLH